MENMFKISLFKYLLVALLLLVNVSQASMSSANMVRVCNGTIEECSVMKEELLMESDISRRFLAETKYLNYKALKPNQPVCGSSAGQPYSKSCLPPKSNTYTRPCYKVYRCKG
ncbi:hypothetical protein GIB67_034922 [Kingdonia uniflora]|uniref:Uncharacterized protein n=1 Tax=Kingdonia uniflora TaxID=39325 RepID=A0A7J7NGK0_9MAGN|nr:hypothetical protein GIB67_034922 [Kingdonia uniflora]